MLNQLNEEVQLKGGTVLVKDLIEALSKFDPQMPVVLGAEGVFQGPPDYIMIQGQRSGELAAVIWDRY